MVGEEAGIGHFLSQVHTQKHAATLKGKRMSQFERTGGSKSPTKVVRGGRPGCVGQVNFEAVRSL